MTDIVEEISQIIESQHSKWKSFVILKMNFFYNATIRQLQWLVWVIVFFIIFVSELSMEDAMEAVAFASITTLSYALIVYGNILFLFPRFYEKGRYFQYFVCVILFLAVVGTMWTVIATFVYGRFFATKPITFNYKNAVGSTIQTTLVYVLSLVFRIALAYFKLKQQAEKMLVQKSQAELNLLKSQVQPHFLFNTLNNIYYEAYREAPQTARLIERLSDIMRYFVDESPKDEVLLTTEIQFLENYIALEKIRIRHDIELNFNRDFSNNVRIPPMLLMTFVENIFKHGTDKTSSANKIELSLIQQDGYLVFETKNSLYDQPGNSGNAGFGIENLRTRLAFLYGDNFELKTISNADFFTAYLKVPLTWF